ncbi:hypothetical protein AUJ46_03990 [Candidatus Peregrinibacteria bacterium CG1_02_54_53]|nr:MAG: hypothetical protein AUJ46_03990 [Candidatus Peregrinibacteria bacterium CG1_02_54_53]
MKQADQSSGFVHALVRSAADIMRTAKTEEELRINFEKKLSPVLEDIGIKGSRYERHTGKTASEYRGRPDAIHGKVIIEYEPPASFGKKGVVEHAEEQLHGYLSAEGYVQGSDAKTLFERPVGVGFDGEQIFFVQFSDNAKKQEFVRHGPYPFDVESARTFLMHLRGLSRRPLIPETLTESFGPDSPIATKIVSALVDALENWGSKRSEVFYNEWKRLFGIVYGEQFGAAQEEEAQVLMEKYGVKKKTEFQKLLFCVHTYFAYLMKLIAIEILAMRDEEAALSESFSSKLAHADDDELKRKLEDIENGGIFASRGITNFLEGDFFRWYLDSWSPSLKEALREVARELSDFEPATTTIHPQTARDLLKKLYQYLVPQLIRHKLGEYYTPDWLAELVMNETGYKGKLDDRMLDPACGSGTFLVLAIQRAKEWAKEHKVPKKDTAKLIGENIWGFDLNPLAVIASRTNYIFALGDLIHEQRNFEIPVYLADSVLSPTEKKVSAGLFGDYYPMKTSVTEFHIPAHWLANKGLQMPEAASEVEMLVARMEEPESAVKIMEKKGLVLSGSHQTVLDFYEQVLALEKEGKNGIWARFLKNVFAPANAGKFDYVIGNPPWIRWDLLSSEYREATRQMWRDYGLFALKGFSAKMGKGGSDFSMLFTYACVDRFVAKNGKLSFLITQEIYKSKGAGEGFRRFSLGETGKFKVLQAHDLVTVKPFESAANKTAAIFIKKGEQTQYPIPYILWNRKKGIGKIPTDTSYEDAMKMMDRFKQYAQPVGLEGSSWQTLLSKDESSIAKGENYYKARGGAGTDPYGVYWIEVTDMLSDANLIVRNISSRGKTKVEAVETQIESDLVFPAVSGANIARWNAAPSAFVLFVNNPDKPMDGYTETVMKNEWPRTHDYLARFKTILRARSAFKKYHEEGSKPFYSQYNVGKYSYANYKVVWKRMANDIHAAVISQWKTIYGWKTIIPLDTTSLIALDDENEAHYLCATINSTLVRDLIKSYSSAGRGFGSPSVMQHIGIPKFDPKNKLHEKLSKLSKELHKLAADRGNEVEIKKLEKEVDEGVTKLFS